MTRKKHTEEYRKIFRTMMKKQALLKLACNQPEVITGKNEAVIDVVLQMAGDYADTILNLRETTKYV